MKQWCEFDGEVVPYRIEVHVDTDGIFFVSFRGLTEETKNGIRQRVDARARVMLCTDYENSGPIVREILESARVAGVEVVESTQEYRLTIHNQPSFSRPSQRRMRRD